MPSGITINRTYDALNRVTEAHYSRDADTISEFYTLDGNGNPTAINQSVSISTGSISAIPNPAVRPPG